MKCRAVGCDLDGVSHAGYCGYHERERNRSVPFASSSPDPRDAELTRLRTLTRALVDAMKQEDRAEEEYIDALNRSPTLAREPRDVFVGASERKHAALRAVVAELGADVTGRVERDPMQHSHVCGTMFPLARMSFVLQHLQLRADMYCPSCKRCVISFSFGVPSIYDSQTTLRQLVVHASQRIGEKCVVCGASWVRDQ
jgi:hypothetical protein